MLGIVGYGGFVASAAALCLTPGIDTVYILTRTVSGGRREGLASALGINAGLVVHTILVAAGLSLVLAASPVAFGAIKVAGAAYLAVMGVRSILSGGSSFSVGEGDEGASTGSSLRTFAQGVLTNVPLNPGDRSCSSWRCCRSSWPRPTPSAPCRSWRSDSPTWRFPRSGRW